MSHVQHVKENLHNRKIKNTKRKKDVTESKRATVLTAVLLVKMSAKQSTCIWPAREGSYVIVNPSLGSTHHLHQWEEGSGREEKEGGERSGGVKRGTKNWVGLQRRDKSTSSVTTRLVHWSVRERQSGAEGEFYCCEQCFEYNFKCQNMMP